MLAGVHTALVTPFTASGELDLNAFEALCMAQLDAGVAGLVPCGTTGEAATLSVDEWSAVVSTAVQVSGGRVPVTAGCGTNSTKTTVAMVNLAAELGADNALVVLPYYNKPSPEGHRRNMREACSVGLPVVAYHVPGRTAQHLPVELLAELCHTQGVVGVKEATGDVSYGSELLALCPDISVLSGDDFTYFPLMCVGAKGVISVVSNLAPKTSVALAQAVAAGDIVSARALHHSLMPLVRYLFSGPNPAPAKAALHARGQMGSGLRLPLVAHEPAPAPELLELQ